jgi:hypothetical protein
VLSSKVHLFDQRQATQWISLSRGGSRGQFLFRGENPPRGALLHYYLGTGAEKPILEIAAMDGGTTFTAELEAKSGIGRYTWGFRFNPPELTKKEKEILDQVVKATDWEERSRLSERLRESLEGRGMTYSGINRRTGRLNDIPADPGVYKVTLKTGDVTRVKSLTVRLDPIAK